MGTRLESRVRVLLGGVCLAALLGPGPVLAQGGPDVQVNQDPPGLVQNETSLTLNPLLPGNLVMAYNDDPYPPLCPGVGVSFSLDGGLTWTDRQLTLPPGTIDAFDPFTGADLLGNVYAGHVSTNGVGGGVYVHRSNDGGNSWIPVSTVAFNLANLNDKPHLAVDTFPASPFANNVYVAWIWELGGGPWSDITFSWSPPGGGLFSTGQQISDLPVGVGMGNGPNIAVASDGTIYVAWIDCDVTQSGQLPGTIFLDRSFDGGINWGADIPVQNVLTVPDRLSDYMIPMNDAVARSFPCIEVSPTNPLEVYMVYPADPDGPWSGDESDVFFIMSGDGGVNWSAPIQLNPYFNGGHEFQPWIDVKPDGTIDVAFYMAPLTDVPPGGVIWYVLVTRSTDGGVTWAPPMPISDVPAPTPTNPWGTPWMGEYLALTVDNTFAYLGFTSSVNDPRGDVFFDLIDNSFIGAWIERFDWYATTTPLPGQSNWEPWAGDPTAGNFYATTAQALSPPNSLEIDAADDAVHQFSGYSSGRWIFEAWSHVPVSMSEVQHFILLNTYPPGPLSDWSLQLEIDGGAGLLRDHDSPAALPLVHGAWADIRVEIDLDADRQSVFYNGLHLVTKGWSYGNEPGGGALNIAAVDLWAAGSSTPVYYDDLSLRDDRTLPCPGDLDGDQMVGFSDLLVILSTWGPCGACVQDLDSDGLVGFSDLLIVLSTWGPCP